jgi:hypothetical protein
MSSQWLAFTTLALAVPVAAACGTGSDVEDVGSAEAATTPTNPVYYQGNPSCADLGLSEVFGIKHDFGSGDPSEITLIIPGYGSITFTHDGTYVDWSSTVGIDAVIVKGGNNANVWFYDPESFGDENLASPINPNNGTPYGLSHVDFCFDFEVEVEKTASTSYERTFTWDIDKSGSVTELLLAVGQVSPAVDYDVDVFTTGYVDSAWAVEGTITVHNPAPVDAVIDSVADDFGGLALPVDCGVEFPYTLAPGATLECIYGAELPSALEGDNLATVTTCGAVGGGEATAAVEFGEPSELTDECVDVSDTYAGVLGTTCDDVTYEYTHTFGPYEVCDETHTETNIASFVTNDTGATGSDDHTVVVTIPACDEGCTLTQGYWKTHSELGPAPYDGTWALLPNGASTTFYLSGATYHEVLWTPPKGNVYFVLAHQYIAATLNGLDGASAPSSVADALADAQALFATYTPAEVLALKGPAGNAVRAEFTSLASTLDDYNNGIIGPGHCSE